MKLIRGILIFCTCTVVLLVGLFGFTSIMHWIEHLRAPAVHSELEIPVAGVTLAPIPTSTPVPVVTVVPMDVIVDDPVSTDVLNDMADDSVELDSFISFDDVVDLTVESEEMPLSAEDIAFGELDDVDVEVEMEYLPVITHVDTNGLKRIAVTIDDCYQVSNLRDIVSLAISNNQKLTLFPIGENLSKKGMDELLRLCYYEYGYEIENHTWSHDKIYRLDDDVMTDEIFKPQVKLSEILGCNYQYHFFRLMGGDGDNDQRTHVYLNQLGYMGIAKWSYSGSDADLEHIKKHLSSGEVLLFHTTDRDTKLLKKLLPWLASKGYELVTLNELLGLPDNETYGLTEQVKPELRDYVIDWHTHKKGDYSWVIYNMQLRLVDMGYLKLDGPATGYYGDQTAKAISKFQKFVGLEATGEADALTQQKLLGF